MGAASDRLAEIDLRTAGLESKLAAARIERAALPADGSEADARRRLRGEIGDLEEDLRELKEARPALQALAHMEWSAAMDARREEQFRSAGEPLRQIHSDEQEMEALTSLLAETYHRRNAREATFRRATNIHADLPGNPIGDAIIGNLILSGVLHQDLMPERYASGTTLTSDVRPITSHSEALLDEYQSQWPRSTQAEADAAALSEQSASVEPKAALPLERGPSPAPMPALDIAAADQAPRTAAPPAPIKFVNGEPLPKGAKVVKRI